MTLAIVIFAATLAAIASERVNRTKVALLGAVLVLLTQTIAQEQAIEAIDWNTIGLLAGMMLIVRLTETTGVYTYLAIRAGQVAKGRPLALVFTLAGATAGAAPCSPPWTFRSPSPARPGWHRHASFGAVAVAHQLLRPLRPILDHPPAPQELASKPRRRRRHRRLPPASHVL